MEQAWNRGGNASGRNTSQGRTENTGSSSAQSGQAGQGDGSHQGHRRKPQSCSAFPEMLTAATVVTYSLTNGRTREEVETLLNFIGLLECQIKFILSQRIIEDRYRQITLNLDL